MERVEGPSDLTVRAWWQALRDAAKRFNERDLTDNAAALTYYSVLAFFPGLIVLVGLLGVLGSDGSVEGLLRIVEDLGDPSAVDTLRPPIENIVDNSGAAGVALIAGLAAALWSASGYVGAFIRTSNEIYGVPEERPFWKRRPLQVAMTLLAAVLVALVMFALVLTGPLVDAVGAELGAGDAVVTAFSIAKWPLVFLVVVGLIALLYRFAPNAHHAGIRWVVPGALLATVLWLAASVGFSVYVKNFGAYANTYGSLAGMIVFLVWLWLTNVAVVFGAQFAAELERTGRAAAHATPPGGFAPFVSAAREEPPPVAEDEREPGYAAVPGAGTGEGSDAAEAPPATPPEPDGSASGSAEVARRE